MKTLFMLSALLLTQSIFAESKYVRENNIIYDKDLKLYWQDNIQVSHTKLTLENSILYCKNLKLGEFTNWRLPTYEELLSIGNYEVYKPTINESFKNNASGHFWSIIYKRVAYGKAWTPKNDFYVKRIYFSDGYSYDNDRTGKAYIRCTREDKKI
ncbi:DUF1566 domain-containing protein [Arcobacteraceae bacterium]|nr:DUF1566 domain-containing protein [Arcobacteraceae bacterium]